MPSFRVPSPMGNIRNALTHSQVARHLFFDVCGCTSVGKIHGRFFFFRAVTVPVLAPGLHFISPLGCSSSSSSDLIGRKHDGRVDSFPAVCCYCVVATLLHAGEFNFDCDALDAAFTEGPRDEDRFLASGEQRERARET